MAQPQHELHMVDDADDQHHDAEPDQSEAEVTRRGGLGDDILIAQLLKHLRDREAEADQRQRGADHRHQRAVSAHARALKRHARAARREFGVHVELEIGLAIVLSATRLKWMRAGRPNDARGARRAAQQQIRNKRQQHRDHRGLAWIETCRAPSIGRWYP